MIKSKDCTLTYLTMNQKFLNKSLNNSIKGLINLKNKDINVLCRVMLDLLILQIVTQKE